MRTRTVSYVLALVSATFCAAVTYAEVATIRLGRIAKGKVDIVSCEGGEGVARFDLSLIPKDSKIHRADLIVFRSKEPAGDDDLRKTNIVIYPLYEEFKKGSAPEGGGEPLRLREPYFDRFDATECVSAWAGGKANGGFLVKTFPLWNKKTVYLDVMYQGKVNSPPAQARGLKVLYRSGQSFITWKEIDDPIKKDEVQWGDLEKILRDVDRQREVRYCIYRSKRPINAESLPEAERVAQVAPFSCWNVNARNKERPRDEVIASFLAGTGGEARFWAPTENRGGPEECPIDRFVIEDNGKPLPTGSGLHVHTVRDKAKAYYAVVTMVDGIQNTVDFSPENSLADPVAEEPAEPSPVLQRQFPPRPAFDYRHKRYQYVQWVSAPYGNMPCQYYNWLVCVPEEPVKSYPVELNLPEPGTGIYRVPYCVEQISIVLIPHDYPVNTWWYGYHEAQDTLKSFQQGTIHNYTERRLLAFIEWTAKTWPVDRNRIMVTGNKAICGSGALGLAMRHHDIFNLVTVSYAIPNFRGAIEKFREVGEMRKVPGIERTFKAICTAAGIQSIVGKLEWDLKTDSNRSVWDELNLTALVTSLPATADLPVVSIADHGGFEPERDFYLALLDRGHLIFATLGVYSIGFFTPISTTGAMTDLIGVDVRKNRCHPAFRGPGSDVLLKPPQLATGNLVVSDGTLQYWGDFNTGYRWNSEDSVDEKDRFEMSLFWRGRHVGASDVTLRRLQKFVVKPGRTYAWQFLGLGEDKEVIQQGEAAPNANGLLTIPKVQISGKGGRLVVTPK